MISVQDIEAAIQTLPPRDQDNLFLWIEQQYAQRFDAVLELGVRRGAFDRLLDEALAEDASGDSKAL
jgi:hypothetical protein